MNNLVAFPLFLSVCVKITLTAKIKKIIYDIRLGEKIAINSNL